MHDCFELVSGNFKCVITVGVDCNAATVFEGLAGVNQQIKDDQEIEFL